MFDDQPTTGNQGPTPVRGGAPTNLPTSQPPQRPSEPEDILGDVDEDGLNIKTPDQSSSPRPVLTSAVPPAMGRSNESVIKEPVFGQKKKVMVILVGILVIGSLAGAAWYGYGLLTSGTKIPSPVNQLNNQGAGQPVVNQNDNQPVVNNQINDEPEFIPEPEVEPIDTDRDGLNDEEEALYGTDPRLVDTDSDGLTDRDEIKVFETDPNNEDSDGDGFPDGNEVRAGFDPKGPGRLLEITQ